MKEPAQSTDNDQIVEETLRKFYGFTAFRPLQRDIVQALLNHRDVVALLPTGGGKSLCYQLPALILPGTAVVVSPLIALMKDQVDALESIGVAATFINSSLDAREIADRRKRLLAGEIKLLYVSPERLLIPEFLELLKRIDLRFFAIDEAHCISEWGHDFRPEYRNLSRLRQIFPGIPAAAFTATATPRVRTDIESQLALQSAVHFQGSFNRRNLFYEVRDKRHAYPELLAYVRAHASESGIVYCGTRATADEIAERLRADGVSAAGYHAGLAQNERRRRQEEFARDDVRVMVATIAFGMGIDKPDVRFVIHYDLPKTLENYYQESGRAGRDGEPADCILFYSPADAARQRRLADDRSSAQEKHLVLWQLQQMVDWAESGTCRRRALLAHFGEHDDFNQSPCCDVCRDPVESEDVTIPAQMLLSCVKRTQERFGVTHVIQVLRGSRNQQVLRHGHERLSTYGIGADRSEDTWRHIARELIRGGFLHQDPDAYNALRVTARGESVLFKGETAVISTSRVHRAVHQRNDAVHNELFQQLRALRKEMADERSVPPYVIASDRTLQDMSARLPQSREELMSVPGIGERKADEFGPAFLRTIDHYVSETGALPVDSNPRPSDKRRTARRTELTPTLQESTARFRAGDTIDEIAADRNLSQSTIEGHLVDAMEFGESLDIDRLVDPAKRAAISHAMAEVGDPALKPVMERLGDGYTYAEIRFVRAWNRLGTERPDDNLNQ